MSGLKGSLRKSSTRETLYRIICALTIASLVLSMVGAILPPPVAQASVVQAPKVDPKSTPTPTATRQPPATATATPGLSPTALAASPTLAATGIATNIPPVSPTATSSAVVSPTLTATPTGAATSIATATATASPTATATASPTPTSRANAPMSEIGPAGGKLSFADLGELVLPKGALSATQRLSWYAVEPRLAQGLRRYHPVALPIRIETFAPDGKKTPAGLERSAVFSLKLDKLTSAPPSKPALRRLTDRGWELITSTYDGADKTLSAEIAQLPATLAVVDDSQPVGPETFDPTDPSAVQLANGHWALAAIRPPSDLIFQKTVTTQPPIYWTAPDVTPLDLGASSPALVQAGGTLALFYIKSVGGIQQAFMLTSSDQGNSWAGPVQITNEVTSLYQIQALHDSGTTYVFYSLNLAIAPGVLEYVASSDLSNWTAPSTVGQPVGINSSYTRASFDIKRLSSGAWALVWLTPKAGAPDDYAYPAVWFGTSTSLSSTTWSNKNDVVAGGVRCIFTCLRWPAGESVGQDSSGTIYFSTALSNNDGADHHLFYRTSSDDGATWSPPLLDPSGNVVQPAPYVTTWSDNSYLVQGNDGTVRSFWDNGSLLYFKDMLSGPITQVVVGTPPAPSPTAEPAPTDGNAIDKGLLTGASRDPVVTLSGHFTYSRTDLAVPGRGPAPVFARSYNSNDTRVTSLRPGWTHSYEVRLRAPGDGSGNLILVGPRGGSDTYTRNPDGTYTTPAGASAALVKNADSTYTATHKDESVWSFDGYGRLTRITDRYGNYSELRYNSTSGKLETITDSLTSTDPTGRGSLSLTYDANGRLESVTDWASPARTVRFEYDASGRLWKVWDRENTSSPSATYGYDGTSSRLATITDANGHVAVTNTYDPTTGKVLTQKDARGLTTGQQTDFGYVVNGDGTRVTTVTYPATSYEPAWRPQVVDYYDASGRLTKRVSKPTSSSAEDITEERGYDSSSNLTWARDGEGNQTDLCYDVDYAGAAIPGSRGNLTRRIDPAPYSGASRPVTLFRYDSKNNLIQTVSPKGVPSGQSASCADNFGSYSSLYATDFAYDPATQTKLESTTSRHTDPDLGTQTATTRFEYGDAANPGLVTRITPPRGNTGGSPDYAYATTMAYYTSGSRAGMLQSTTDALGNVTTYDYDSVGRRVSMVDPNGNAAGGVPAEHTWSYSYDNEDRPLVTLAPAPAAGGSALRTEFRYDVVGNRTVVIDAGSQVTRYAYDERDSLAEVHQSDQPWTDPAATPNPDLVTAYEYDHAGNLSRVVRARGTGPTSGPPTTPTTALTECGARPSTPHGRP